MYAQEMAWFVLMCDQVIITSILGESEAIECSVCIYTSMNIAVNIREK